MRMMTREHLDVGACRAEQTQRCRVANPFAFFAKGWGSLGQLFLRRRLWSIFSAKRLGPELVELLKPPSDVGFRSIPFG